MERDPCSGLFSAQQIAADTNVRVSRSPTDRRTSGVGGRAAHGRDVRGPGAGCERRVASRPVVAGGRGQAGACTVTAHSHMSVPNCSMVPWTRSARTSLGHPPVPFGCAPHALRACRSQLVRPALPEIRALVSGAAGGGDVADRSDAQYDEESARLPTRGPTGPGGLSWVAGGCRSTSSRISSIAPRATSSSGPSMPAKASDRSGPDGCRAGCLRRGPQHVTGRLAHRIECAGQVVAQVGFQLDGGLRRLPVVRERGLARIGAEGRWSPAPSPGTRSRARPPTWRCS